MAWVITDYGNFSGANPLMRASAKDCSVVGGYSATVGAWTFSTRTNMFTILPKGDASSAQVEDISGDGNTAVGITSGTTTQSAVWSGDSLSIPYPASTPEFSWLYAVSHTGDFVAGMESVDGESAARVYSRSAGNIALPENPFGLGATALSVAAEGSAVFGVTDNAENYGTVFRWTPGSGTVVIDPSPSENNSPSGYNMRCSMDGATAAWSPVFGGYMRVRVYRNESYEDVGTLGGNEAYLYGASMAPLVVVGDSSDSNGDYWAYRWTPEAGIEKLSTPDGAAYSWANGVQEGGSIVVGNTHTPDGVRPCLWDANGDITLLPHIEGVPTYANYISSDGSVIVGSTFLAGERRIVVWRYNAFWTGAINCAEQIA